MSQSKIDFHPLEISRESYQVVRQSLLQLAFAGGIFYLLAFVVVIVSRMMMSEAFVLIGGLGFSMISGLAGISVSLVATARAMNVDVPFLPSALIHERQFWKFVLGWLVIGMLSSMPILIGMQTAVSTAMPAQKVTSLFDTALAPAAACIIAGLALTVLVAIRLSLVLPAVILGEKISPTASWRRTGPVFWKLLAASILTISPLVIVQSLVNAWAQQSQDPSVAIVAAVLTATASLLQLAAGGALCGLVMTRIVSSVPDRQHP